MSKSTFLAFALSHAFRGLSIVTLLTVIFVWATFLITWTCLIPARALVTESKFLFLPSLPNRRRIIAVISFLALLFGVAFDACCLKKKRVWWKWVESAPKGPSSEKASVSSDKSRSNTSSSLWCGPCEFRVGLRHTQQKHFHFWLIPHIMCDTCKPLYSNIQVLTRDGIGDIVCGRFPRLSLICVRKFVCI